MNPLVKGPKRLLAAALFMALAAVASAAPTKQDALDAISTLENNILGPGAPDAAKTIVVFAQLSDEVMVDVGPDQMPWLSEDWGLDSDREAALHSLLLAAFVAGDVKPQLRNQKAADDTYSGWIFAIAAYRKIAAKENIKSPSIEALAKMQSEGKLLDHARELQQGDEDDSAPDKAPFA